MYAKLFSRITESSLIEESITTRWVFVAMLAIAEPDGTVIGTDIAIARRINVPLKDFEESMKVLMSEDRDSNNQDHEGARIIPSVGERGYFLTGYQRYRGLKTEDDRRAYMAQYMARKRASVNNVNNDVNSVNIQLAQLTHAEAELNTKPKKEIYTESFLEFWKIYPRKSSKGDAFKAWRSLKLDGEKVVIEKLKEQLPSLMKCEMRFIKLPATWLNARCWEDEIDINYKPETETKDVRPSLSERQLL